MTAFNADNYKASRVTEPSSKYPTGENGGLLRVQIDKVTLVDAAGTAGLDSGDTINCGFLPKGAKVVDAYIRINKSLGATGIIDLGYGAHTDEAGDAVAADANAFVSSADGGGQAALQRADVNGANAGIGKRFLGEAQIIATLTEVMDDSVLDAEMEIVVEYVTN